MYRTVRTKRAREKCAKSEVAALVWWRAGQSRTAKQH